MGPASRRGDYMNERPGSDLFVLEVDTIRDLTLTEAEMAAGGLQSENHSTTWTTTSTFSVIPGTEWTVATMTTVVG